MKIVQYLLIVLVVVLLSLTFVYILLLVRNNTSRGLVTTTPSITPPSSTLTPTTLSPIDLPEPSDSIALLDSPIDVTFIQEYASSEAKQRPDITITNNVPFENDYFVVTTEFVQANPGYFKVVVYTKSDNQPKVQEEFMNWVKGLGVPEDSVSKLTVEYRDQNDPDMM